MPVTGGPHRDDMPAGAAGGRRGPLPAPGRSLLVASTGGHLDQLWRLRQRFTPELTAVEWATFDGAQSRSMLEGQVAHYVPYIPPRGYRQLARAMPHALRILRSGGYDRVISTGSGIALAFLPAARALGVPTYYIESAARASGPSVTGSFLARLPGTRTYSQYRSWSGPQWHYGGSVFDGYGVMPCGTRGQARRVVVTFGTMRRYGFRRALDAVMRVLPDVLAPGAEVLWQVGATDCTGLLIDGEVNVSQRRLRTAMADADLVIAHAGIGSILTALDAGRCPVVLPRHQAYGEHIDDHQELIAGELHQRHLAVRRLPDELSAEDLRTAMSRSVVAADPATGFHLDAAG